MKSKYKIKLVGCDADTDLIVFLNDEQVKLIKTLSKLSKKMSTFGCEPTMSIKRELK